MAKIHVLERTGANTWRCILHALIPTGGNSAGVTWKAAAIASGDSGPNHAGQGKASVLSLGTGAGQITQAEYDQLVAGDVIEFDESIRLESGGTAAAPVDALADKIAAQRKTALAEKLRWYGRAQGTVS